MLFDDVADLFFWLKFHSVSMFTRSSRGKTENGARVTGILPSSKTLPGFRRRVYEYASVNAGIYTSEDRNVSIGYLGKDLVLDIAFHSMEAASKFVGVLELLYPDDIEADLTIMTDSRRYHPRDLIRYRHYVSKEFDSPPATISESSVYSMVPRGSGLARFQSLEEYHPKFESCHMYDKKNPEDPAYPNHKNNRNNRLCLTPTAHALYDSVSSECAYFAVKVLRTYEEAKVCEVDGKLEARYRIDVAVEFMSIEARGYFTNVFKDGTETISPTEVHSFVEVENVGEFVAFMTWKYKDTTRQWP